MKFHQRKNYKTKPFLYCSLAAFLGIGLLFTSDLFAQATVSTAVSIKDVQETIGKTVVNIATIISNIALVAGIGFLLASFFKFDQHKKNPTQIPISQPLTLLLIGAGLCLFPTIMPLVQTSVFGTSAKTGQVGTGTAVSLIGGASS